MYVFLRRVFVIIKRVPNQEWIAFIFWWWSSLESSKWQPRLRLYFLPYLQSWWVLYVTWIDQSKKLHDSLSCCSTSLLSKSSRLVLTPIKAKKITLFSKSTSCTAEYYTGKSKIFDQDKVQIISSLWSLRGNHKEHVKVHMAFLCSPGHDHLLSARHTQNNISSLP